MWELTKREEMREDSGEIVREASAFSCECCKGAPVPISFVQAEAELSVHSNDTMRVVSEEVWSIWREVRFLPYQLMCLRQGKTS